MEIREIKALLALMNEHGLVELEIEDKKGKVRLVRGIAGNAAHGAAELARRHVAPPTADPGSHSGQAGASAVPQLAPNQKLIESPMVGTFYRAPSPGAPPFVEEGTSVRKGQTLCIIEAMKMMNEIDAPAAGRVVKFLCENGQPIQYGQPLMIVEVG
jgi:acetyl-CoA carboxylase biotin carboxyl carrier protein